MCVYDGGKAMEMQTIDVVLFHNGISTQPYHISYQPLFALSLSPFSSPILILVVPPHFSPSPHPSSFFVGWEGFI